MALLWYGMYGWHLSEVSRNISLKNIDLKNFKFLKYILVTTELHPLRKVFDEGAGLNSNSKLETNNIE